MNIREINQQVIEEYRANDGVLSGQFAGSKLTLLTTIGVKSGLPRTTPLGYWMVDDRMVLVASNMGAAKHPDWYLNLLGNSDVTIELPGKCFQTTVEIPAGVTRDHWFNRVADTVSFFHEHQKQTERVIPVILITIPS